MNKRSFLLLTTPERRNLFDEVLTERTVRTVHSVREAVRQCVCDPPLAVLIDLSSTLHSGGAETAPLYNLGIDLPVLRCTGGTQGPWIAMCQAPFKRLPLSQAVEEIGAGEASWKQPVNMRRYVRVTHNARILLSAQEGVWKKGNAQSMSVSGLFLLTLDAPAVGTDVSLRILDCGEGEIALKATTDWVHNWDEGPHLPGCGLNFDRSTVDDALSGFLADAFFKQH